MLSLKNRLKKKKDFDWVFKKGKSCKGNFVYLKYKKTNSTVWRLGVVVSKKISNKAVVRNKLKRRLLESVGSIKNNIKNGVDVILVSQPGLEKKDFIEIQNIVRRVFKEADLFNT